MNLTRFTNYALRTLAFAALGAPHLATIDGLASAHGIARTHIVKCVHRLGQWGYLENVRGRSGGFRLSKAPHEIRIGEIVRLTEEGTTPLVECFDPATSTCPLTGRCLMSEAFRAAHERFMETLDAVTIADIIANDAELRSLLHMPPAGGCKPKAPCPTKARLAPV